MPTLILLILGRTVFVAVLLLVAAFGLVSLIGYPGPFILTAFSLGGLPAWVIVPERRHWLVAAILASIACVVPVLLLIKYTGDGDFTVPSLVIQIVVLGVFAYFLAFAGLMAGWFVWRRPEA